jgi:hypothetical protein
MKVGLIMTKKETKKTDKTKTLSKAIEVLPIKDNPEDLKMHLNFNADYLPTAVIKVNDKRLVDNTYFKNQIDNLTVAIEKSEEAKNVPVILTGAELMVKRLNVLTTVHKEANHPDKLRKLLVKELTLNIKVFNEANDIAFGASQRASRTSQLARMSKIAMMLSLFSDKVKVKVNGDKRSLEVVNSMAKPIVTQFVTNPNGGKPVMEKLLNSQPNKFDYCSNDSVEVLYNHYVNGKPLPKNMMLDDAEENKGKDTKGSESESDGGATAGTVNNKFQVLYDALNFMLTKDPKKFSEEVLETDFTKGVNAVDDPSKILTDRKSLLAIIDWISIFARLQSEASPYMADEKKQKALKETLQDITELGIGRLGETLKAKQA